MRIPKSIKVGGRTYTIEFKKNLWRETGFKGHIIFDTQQIEMDDSLGSADLSTIFFHETIHAIDRIWGNNDLSESETNFLAEGLFQVLSDMGITFER